MTNLIRWNANFVKGLAESVLQRAQGIRATLAESTEAPKKAKRPRKAKVRKKRNG